MFKVQTFEDTDFGKIRAMAVDNTPWFVGNDVATALGYVNPQKALTDRVDDVNKNTVTICDGDVEIPDVTIINKPGANTLASCSNKICAEWFMQWVDTAIDPVICVSNEPEPKLEPEPVTKNGLSVLDYKGNDIRMQMIDGKPWWVLADVCNVIGIANPWNVAARLDASEKNTLHLAEGVRGNPNVTIVNEPGLYNVIQRSNKPEAKPFMKWVNEEVLPEIHKQNVPEPVATEGLTALNYKGSNVRIQMIDGEPWWVLADVCRVLELSEPHRVAARLDDDEKGRTQMTTLGGKQDMTIVNEPGLYNVILRSDKPEAKDFKRWVTHDVLPTIRKTGSYTVGQKMLAIPKDYPSALRALADQFEKNLALEAEKTELAEENAVMQPKAVFADTVQKSKDNIYVADMAKILYKNGVKTGQKRLFTLLREKGILMMNNVPYQQYIDRGYFEVKEDWYEDHKGLVHLHRTSLVTPRGQVWLANNVPKWMDKLGM